MKFSLRSLNQFLLLLTRERERESKFTHLKIAIDKLDLLKFFLKLLWEIKVLDNKKYIALSECLYEVGKMIGGWQKSLNNR